MDTAGLILALALLAQPAPEPLPVAAAPVAPPATTPAIPPATPAAPATALAEPARCDARPWQWIRGRVHAELLRQQLPPRTLITRVGDPPLPRAETAGRLVFEIGRNTRIRRVYCG
jgi:hypothetical protein